MSLRRNTGLDDGELRDFVLRTEILLRLLSIADEASAANHVGLDGECRDALRRYHAVRAEHAEHVDIRVV